MRKIVVLLILGIGILSQSNAQDVSHEKPTYLHSGKIGLGLDGISGSPNLLLKYFFNNQLAMQGIVGLDMDFPGGTEPTGQTKVNGITLRGGISVLIHLTPEQVSPYVGVEGIFQYDKQGGFYNVVPDPKNSIFGDFLAGAEYFINEKFTIGIRQGVGVQVLLKRDLPKEETELKLNTSTLLSGRFYFN